MKPTTKTAYVRRSILEMVGEALFPIIDGIVPDPHYANVGLDDGKTISYLDRFQSRMLSVREVIVHGYEDRKQGIISRTLRGKRVSIIPEDNKEGVESELRNKLEGHPIDSFIFWK